MKNIFINIALLLLLLLGIVITFNYIKSLHSDLDRLKSNIINISNENIEIYTKLILKDKELKLIKPKLDSVIKSKNIKQKHIESIYSISVKEEFDSISIKPSQKTDTTITYYINQDCLTGKIKYSSSDSSLIIDNIEYTNNFDITYYQKRDTTKILRFWPFAKLKRYSKQINNCNGTVYLQEITFIK